jgi:hypothetical protein
MARTAQPIDRPEPEIIAYEVAGPMKISIVRAPMRRDWMNETESRFAYRCLPMVIANQMGWWILNQVEFEVTWNGGPLTSDVSITMPGEQPGFGEVPADQCVVSNFGTGIITFRIPYLFRTPPGTNLWVRGPANYCKDGVQALEGIVEADWSYSTFTMNWKLTRPNHAIHFAVGEPICQLLPFERQFVEKFHPWVDDIQRDEDLARAYVHWTQRRGQFIHDLAIEGSEAQKQQWQHEYFEGLSPAGTPVEQHQTKLHLAEFVRRSPGPSE